jgi:hypothetical protein
MSPNTTESNQQDKVLFGLIIVFADVN